MEVYCALELLRHRVKGGVTVRTDSLRTLRQRSGLSAEPAVWSEWDGCWKPSAAVHRYFMKRLQSADLPAPQPVWRLQSLDRPVSRPVWRYPDVLAQLAAALEPVWPGAAARIDTLLREHRIEPGSPPARCLYDRSGPRVILPAGSGDTREIFRLAHEIGHALDAMVRAESGDTIPGPLLMSEVRAIQSELVLVAYLTRHGSAEWRALARWWQNHRRRDCWYYHRMLHRFECGLYEQSGLTRASVSDWWMALNAGYFGPAVLAGSLDPEGWLDQMPLLITPFRFWSYPLAWHQARRTMPDVPVHPRNRAP